MDGVDYKFLSVDEFLELERTGKLLEKGVYEGEWIMMMMIMMMVVLMMMMMMMMAVMVMMTMVMVVVMMVVVVMMMSCFGDTSPTPAVG